MYNKRTWLDKPDSSSTGSIIAFDGETTWAGVKVKNTFLSISDSNNSIKLSSLDDDAIENFKAKLKLLKNEIESFIDHLERTHN